MIRKIPLRPGDWLAFVLVFSLTILSAFIVYGNRSLPGVVRIRTDKESFIYPLDKDRTILVESAVGPSVVVIENGQVRMKEARCPEQLCVHSPPISRPGESITCLPGHVMIIIEQKKGEGPDAEAW